MGQGVTLYDTDVRPSCKKVDFNGNFIEKRTTQQLLMGENIRNNTEE